MTTGHRRTLGWVSSLTGALLLLGCASEGVVQGSAEVVDRRTEALLAADLESAIGTYTNCADRTGSWSLEIESGAVLDEDPLSVVMNDVDCVLTLTDLRTTAGVLMASPAIALDTTYEATASSFGAPDFYANAQLDAAGFATDFVVTILYSDDSNFATVANTAMTAVTEATASGESVDAPDYTVDMMTLLVMTDVDDVVASVSGSVGLTVGTVTGQRYVVLDQAGLGAASYDVVEDAYNSVADAALGASLPASDFMSLVGADLGTASEVRTLIIANTVSGVVAYQVVTITFNPVM